MADLARWPDDPQHNAAAMALQIWAGLDPDGSRYLALKVVAAVHRADVRPTDGLPTEAEVDRAFAALKRRYVAVTHAEVREALTETLCPSLETMA